MEFQVGDIVEFGGEEGVISRIQNNEEYCIYVDTISNNHEFTIDGKYFINHTKPLLNFVSRPKKTRLVMKYPVLYKRVDNGQLDITTTFYETFEQCKVNQPVSLLTNLGQQFEEEI